MAPLRWGILSAGKISNDFCAALSTLPAKDHKVVAVAARSLSDAKSFAGKYEISKFYEGYDKLAQDPEIGEQNFYLQINSSCKIIFIIFADIVYIGSVNSNHLEHGTLMLNGGKHILCEKPLTLNENQSKKLLELAKSKNLLCVEAIWSRFFPSYKLLRSRIDNGDLGEILEVDVSFGFNLTAERVV